MEDKKEWWKETILYQVYPRSLQDSTHNGLGDLPGITSKVELFSQFLGVNALWLSPVYPSPQADHGYDIANYTDVDPQMGTLNDFDALVSEANRHGVRILMDGVFNHCSDRHPWFQEARADPRSPTRNHFIWHPGPKPPNNWGSVMGGKAWSWSETAQAWYLHSFLPQQPDLNWRNSEVRTAILEVMRFWLDRGVSGFRLDVFNCYLKDVKLRSNPLRKDLLGRLSRWAWPYGSQHHIHDRDQAELSEVLEPMRELVDEYGAVLLGETLDERFQYSNAAQWVGEKRLHLAFNFGLLHSPWDARAMGAAIRSWTTDLGAEGWPTWVLSNHDFVRHATRWGGRHGEARMRLAAILLLGLRGTPCLYQGEELGMRQGKIPRQRIQDPAGRRYWPFFRGRDGSRTPMQWNGEPGAGFTEGEPWLPINPDSTNRNYESQQANADSLLNLYRNLITLRRTLPALSRGHMELPATDHPSILTWVRSHGTSRIRIRLNLSNAVQKELPDRGEILLSTHPRNDSMHGRLRPHEGQIIRCRGPR